MPQRALATIESQKRVRGSFSFVSAFCIDNECDRFVSMEWRASTSA